MKIAVLLFLFPFFQSFSKLHDDYTTYFFGGPFSAVSQEVTKGHPKRELRFREIPGYNKEIQVGEIL